MTPHSPMRDRKPVAGFRRDLSSLAISLAVCGLLAVPTHSGRTQPIPATTKGAIMSDKRVATYDRYLAAWGAVSDAERERMLQDSVAENVVFENPQQTRRGRAELTAHLQGFQARTPGGAFRMNNMVGWDGHVLAEWQLVDAKGQPGFSGYDVLTFDDQGRISTILLFGNVEAQKLAWRRRDPVTLTPTP